MSHYYHLLDYNGWSFTAWKINECKSFPLLFVYFFVIFAYYSVLNMCTFIAGCSTRLPSNLFRLSLSLPLFYVCNFHLFIITSQAATKTLSIHNDKWHRWYIENVSFFFHSPCIHLASLLWLLWLWCYIYALLVLILKYTQQWNRTNCLE